MTALSAWVPRYIMDPTHDLSGTPISAEYWNNLWLINQLQGDDTTATLKQLVDEIYATVWHPTSAAEHITNPEIYPGLSTNVSGQLSELRDTLSSAKVTIAANSTNISRIGTGVMPAGDALKLGGQLPVYYATTAALAAMNTVIDNLTIDASSAFSHNNVANRDAADAHPIASITGLADALSAPPVEHVHSFTSLTSKPTTLAGYGITDAALAGAAPTAHSHSYASLTSKPSTLAGFGITDAAASNHGHTFAAIASKPSTLVGYGITDASPSSHAHSFASLNSKPTTLAGYGITDAALAGAAPTYHEHSFASLTSKPSTIAGYGITDSVYKTAIIISLAGAGQNVAQPFTVPVPAGVFPYTPNAVLGQCASTPGMVVGYRHDSSSATSLSMWVLKCDGALGAGNYRFSIMAGA